MIKQRIPLLTPTMLTQLPDQTTEILNRLIEEVNEHQKESLEITNEILALKKAVKNIQPGPTPTPGDYNQLLQFNLENMGSEIGWCLKNTRLGFGITTGHFTSARADMESQIANGTLHSGTPPMDISVPIYYDNIIAEGHVAVWDKGKVYSDKNPYPSIDSVDRGYMGWGEFCDGTRVVEKKV